MEGDGEYSLQMREMRDKTFCLSRKFTEQQGRANRAGAEPAILEFERKLISKAKKLGIPLFAHCVVRTKLEQDRLFVMGRTKAMAGQSPHNWGCAVDIVHGTKGWDLTRKQWTIIGHLGQELANSMSVPDGYKIVDGKKVPKTKPLSLVWGGHWDFYDPAHWELRDWRDIRARLKAAAE